MSIARRIATAGILTAATAGALLAGPAGQALAAPTPEVALVRVFGSITTVDDDFDFDPLTTIEFSRLISVDSHNPYSEVMVESGCAGGEVRAELNIGVVRRPNSVDVQPAIGHLGVEMFEGASCFSDDFDGGKNFGTVIFQNPGKTTRTFTATDTEEGSTGRATVKMTVVRVQ